MELPITDLSKELSQVFGMTMNFIEESEKTLRF